MGRTLVLGDVHGGYKALEQVLARAKVNYAEDKLIFLGDIADGWPDTKECIDELLKIDNLVALWGNHDWWAWEWMSGYNPQPIWIGQGGAATLISYKGARHNIPSSHKKYFKSLKDYYIDEEYRVFVHGGWPEADRLTHPSAYIRDTLMWDRSLWAMAQREAAKYGGGHTVTAFNEIYVGHTSTTFTTKTYVPTKRCEVWNMDTGGGWEGKISIMDVDTKDFWQSDVVADLYPEDKRRRA